MKKICLTVIIAATSLAGCRGGNAATERGHYTLSNDTVYLHSPDLYRERIKLSGTTEESVAREVVTAGTVQAIPTRFAYVAPPFSGRITRSYVEMGQRVSAYTPLFEIISPEFTAMQKEYFQAESEREMARKDLERKRELIVGRLCSEREFEEAENALRQAEKEYENARAALEIYHVDTENMTLGQPLVVRSPISGEVIDNNIVVGLYLNDDADPVAVVADLSHVWIAAQVKEKDIRHITEGDRMTVMVTALPGTEIEGTVFHVEEAVDEDTRSIRVLSSCDNRGIGLKLGMYATVHFKGEQQKYTVLPEKAVMQGESHSYVLTQAREECFVRQPVDVAFTREGMAYVSSGICQSDVVVCEGGYYFQ